MTSAEFVVWEERQDRKWEFDGFQPVAMNGGTIAHSAIQRNILVALATRLKGNRCAPYGPDVRVPIPSGSYRYPDALVTCEKLAPKSRDVSAPIDIFEVLSDSTARVDRTEKLPEYLSIPSVQRYVMLEQDAPFITVVTRSDTGWALSILRADDTLALPEIGLEIPLAEFYIDVEFEPPPE